MDQADETDEWQQAYERDAEREMKQNWRQR